jgi:hypothetical protein
MLTPDYQEFTNRASAGSRYNTVIYGIGTGEAVEIIAALRDCHGSQPARNRNFPPNAAEIAALGSH